MAWSSGLCAKSPEGWLTRWQTRLRLPDRLTVCACLLIAVDAASAAEREGVCHLHQVADAHHASQKGVTPRYDCTTCVHMFAAVQTEFYVINPKPHNTNPQSCVQTQAAVQTASRAEGEALACLQQEADAHHALAVEAHGLLVGGVEEEGSKG